jgi:hypothetical protein
MPMAVLKVIHVARDHTPVFLDKAYVNALVNTRDQWHAAAVQWEQKLAADTRRLVTTEFVLVEIADGLAAVRFRAQATHLIATLQASPSSKPFLPRLNCSQPLWPCIVVVLIKIGDPQTVPPAS